MQIQIDPSVPTNIPPGQLDDMQGFLSGVLNSIIGSQRSDSTEQRTTNSGPGWPPSWLSGQA